MTFRVASAAYPIEPVASFGAYVEKIARTVAVAADGGGRLLVFPEYGAVELSAALPAADSGEIRRELHGLQRFLDPSIEAFSALAKRHDVYILAPSFPELDPGSGRFHNRARLHAPNGAVGVSEKLQMTRFESEEWGIDPGRQQRVFATELGKVGVAICYDSEFPALVRAQIDAGAELMLVPSCTDTLAGYHRVALSCRARALENQCYVVQSSTIGDAPWSIPLDHNRGAAAIYGPVDRGFADDGVLAQGSLDVPGWVFADLDLAALAEVRASGQVRNHRDQQSETHRTTDTIVETL
ncbi:MAG TPA: carbon-nitrogen hydrolase family protein [Polyangiales bacterium]